jgi:mono/diheme cytochrome c family protein
MIAENQINWRLIMRKVLKWVGIVIGSLIALVVVAAAGLNFSSNARLNKSYDIQPESVSIPGDAAGIAEGEHIARVYCAGCHGDDFGGKIFFNDPALAVVYAPNLTPGEGGAGAYFTDEDWVRAIRHGVDPEGKPLFIMPSNDFYHFSDEDLGQLIGFLKSTSPVDNVTPERQTGFMGGIIMGVGGFGNVITAETIDHDGPRPEAPQVGISAAYGKYMVDTIGCYTCHGAELAGGNNPEPGAPPGPNLTPAGALGSWSEADFINVMRTRSSDYMPYESFAKLTDDELKAIWAYLGSLAPLETANK